MKFGKNLIRVVELSDPEWGPFFMNYKYLKQRINDIVEETGGIKVNGSASSNPVILSKSLKEVDFFHALKAELKKTSDFFSTTEQLYRIRHSRILDGYQRLLDDGKKYDKNTWSRLLRACVKFYKDVLLLENFAIMNYCGFSKILKKHDKLTGFTTREKFMRNVMSKQNFTDYPYVLELLKKSEQLYADIQAMESVMPLEDEERLFIDAIRDLNHQASCVQREENAATSSYSDGSDADSHDDVHQSAGVNVANGEISAGAGLDAAALAVMAAANKSMDQSTPDLKMVMSWIQAVKGAPSPTDKDETLASELGLEREYSQQPSSSSHQNKQVPSCTSAATDVDLNPASVPDITKSAWTSPAQAYPLNNLPSASTSADSDEFNSYQRGGVFVATRKRLSPSQDDVMQNGSSCTSKYSRIV